MTRSRESAPPPSEPAVPSDPWRPHGDFSGALGPDGEVTARTFAALMAEMSHTSGAGPIAILGTAAGRDQVGASVSGSGCRVFPLPAGRFCSLVQSLASYAETAKDLVSSDKAGQLADLQVNPKYDNIVHGTAAIGGRTTIGAGCYVGEGCSIGDKVAVKRSLVGNHCRIGDNVKITNSVVLDDCVIESGAQLQNCVVGSGCKLRVSEGRDMV